MTQPFAPRQTISIFCCGGTGLNIARQLASLADAESDSFARIQIVCIDTSRSNIKGGLTEEQLYLVDGLDGSGKKRDENAAVITEHVASILMRHRPSDMNIVLSSAGGGSGSVLAPSILSELQKRDIPVMAFVIGSTETKLDVHNSLRTLKTYEAISQMRKKPVVMYYAENSDSEARAKIDNRITSAISCLAGLYSGTNSELDSQDLFNWLNFDRVTGFKPALASLHILSEERDARELKSIISVASLYREGNPTGFFGIPHEYRCYGFRVDNANALPMHYVVSDGLVASTAQRLQGVLDSFDEQAQARLKTSSILGQFDTATENGLVL